ncbi:MAG: YjbQ family protein [Magnetococcales bacterium]|nr:YjbQ family protein [Magnetococcales bacterium]
MRQAQTTFQISTSGQRLYEITDEVKRWLAKEPVGIGIVTLFCCHTSASLTIQENADSDVLRDLQQFYSRLVPENASWYRHTCEGPDDMPAHIKGSLTDVSLSIPVTDGGMVLGVWQGIYLFEHRLRPHSRKVVAHYQGV